MTGYKHLFLDGPGLILLMMITNMTVVREQLWITVLTSGSHQESNSPLKLHFYLSQPYHCYTAPKLWWKIYAYMESDVGSMLEKRCVAVCHCVASPLLVVLQRMREFWNEMFPTRDMLPPGVQSLFYGVFISKCTNCSQAGLGKLFGMVLMKKERHSFKRTPSWLQPLLLLLETSQQLVSNHISVRFKCDMQSTSVSSFSTLAPF